MYYGGGMHGEGRGEGGVLILGPLAFASVVGSKYGNLILGALICIRLLLFE